MTPTVHVVGGTEPEGLLTAFWDYEQALMSDDLAAMDRLFAPGDATLRGDPGGLLVGHDEIRAFRSVRGGAPARTVLEVWVHVASADSAVVVAVTAPDSGGRGQQTQLWSRHGSGWVVRAAHVSPPPRTFDATVWRVVGDPLVPPTGDGPLRGESVAVKDLFAVAGQRTGVGVPAWEAGARVEPDHASAVGRLLAAGASVRGIARTDQLAYSLAGDNPHFGTPPNGVVPDALPGGSSSGSASAVALGAASVGLGTDTGGSIRVPASYQGLWGLRTTHDAVPREGLVPLAPEFDTVGLLTRSAGLLERAARVLLARMSPVTGGAQQATFVRLGDLAGVERATARAFSAYCGAALPVADRLDVGSHELAEFAEAFRIHQARQAWQTHGEWIEAHPGAVRGPAGARFAGASAVTAAEDAEAREALATARSQIDDALGDAVLVLPSAASAAPRLWASPDDVDVARAATLRLTCLAGITGRPAVSAPLLTTPTGPVGVCLVGPRGSDLDLITLAARLMSDGPRTAV